MVLLDTVVADTSFQVTGLSNAAQYFWRVRAGNASGVSPWSEVFYFTTSTIDVGELPGLPTAFMLHQNYPNPFNPTTRITFTLSSQERDGVRSHVTLKVYDPLGRDVRTLVNEILTPGSYTVEFDATNLSSGIYLYRMTAGGFTFTRKMLLLR